MDKDKNLVHLVPQFCKSKIQVELETWFFIFHVGLMDRLILRVQDGFPQV